MHKNLVNKVDLEKLKRQISNLKSEWESYSLPPEVQKKLAEIEQALEEEPKNTLQGVGLSAQVSIYPLRAVSLSPIINETLHIFNHYGLEVYPGSMSTLISGEDKIIWSALSDAFTAAVVKGEVVMTITISNACPLPSNFNAG